MDKLGNVIWTIPITLKKGTGETLFSLVYGFEVVSPIEMVLTSHRVKYIYTTVHDNKHLHALDRDDERH